MSAPVDGRGRGRLDAPAEALRLPPGPRGLRIGLFGGSFDPPHAGHLLVARSVLRRLRLDRLWWIVTPGNPLKDHGHLAPLAERIAASRAVAGADRRIVVTAFEAARRIRYTADALDLVLRERPGARFVWVMGADSLRGFHRWQDWRRIAASVPIAVVDRPGATLSVLSSPAALTLEGRRIPEREAARLADAPAPAWVFLTGPRSAQSSTGLRAASAATARPADGGRPRALTADGVDRLR